MTKQVYGYQGPDELPRRPTPKQVRDFYDVHTDIGTVNFSNADDGLSLELWHALNLAIAERDRALEELSMTLHHWISPQEFEEWRVKLETKHKQEGER